MAESGENGGREGVGCVRVVEHDQGAVNEICTCSVWCKGGMMEVGSDSTCSGLGSGALGGLSVKKELCMTLPASDGFGAKGGMEDGKESDNTSDECGAVGQFNRMALLNLNLEDYTRSLMISQICEPSVYVDEGLMQLLQSCYEEDHKQTSAMVLFSGCIEHFESRVMEDLGWGCGWRNIQMLCSYLLVQDTAMKEALFGGAGFIPNIFAMQRWLEIAWAKGFDVAGADYFDWKISGTEKWIGTTECAALLRSFGVRAWIVDFQAVAKGKKDGPRPKCGSLEAGPFDTPPEPGEPDESDGNLHAQASTSAHGQHDEHGNVELCVARVEERLSHKKCELCLSCMELRKRKETAEFGSFLQITSEQQNREVSSGGGLSDQDEVDVNHKHMTNWIWNYFLDNKGDVGTVAAAAAVPSITLSSRSPLYFQHQGHSRTIVGIERCHGTGGLLQEDKLIILDPSQQTSDLVSCLRKKQGWQNLIERGVHTLKQAEYQLCYIEPGIAVGEELESLKFLSTMRYKY